MERTKLIQILEAPPKSELQAKINHAFSGIFQASSSAWDVLDSLFTLRYMGSSEFEFGAVPNCLAAMAKDRAKLEAFKMTIDPSVIKRNIRRKTQDEPKEQTVFVLCRKEHKEEVAERIRECAQDRLRLKESSRFPEALDPVDSWDWHSLGWLELNNGFFFFLNEPMWKKTCELFGVAT